MPHGRLEPHQPLARLSPELPDSLPVIGPSTRFANAFYAFGHGHVGMCGASTTGRAIADLVAGRSPCAPLAPFRPGRFS